MSILKLLVSLGSEFNSGGGGNMPFMQARRVYRGRYNNDGSVDIRFDKAPAQAKSLNSRLSLNEDGDGKK